MTTKIIKEAIKNDRIKIVNNKTFLVVLYKSTLNTILKISLYEKRIISIQLNVENENPYVENIIEIMKVICLNNRIHLIINDRAI